MDANAMHSRAASFGGVADDYAQHRPGYPAQAVQWLVGTTPGRVLELGAGTGRLTQHVVGLGHEVLASDPAADMLRHLHAAVPDAAPLLARAEAIPLQPSSVDVVIAAQAFHWFDAEEALPEIARVLRPGGALALVWNAGDFKIPWVKRVFELIDQPDAADLGDPVAGSDLFASSESRVFRHWQEINKETLLGFVASTSKAATVTPDERAALLAQVGGIYDSYDRGSSGMRLPWQSRCYRARVSGLAAQVQGAGGDGYDDALLIDFP